MRKMQAESLAELVRMAAKLELPPTRSSSMPPDLNRSILEGNISHEGIMAGRSMGLLTQE